MKKIWEDWIFNFWTAGPNGKCDPFILQAAENFAREADYSEQTGWAQEGWKPCGGYYVGGECGQGFFHTLFYKRQAMLKEQFQKIGQKWNALQIDKCMWNYQTSYQCNNFDCSRVRVHHKPMQPGSDHRECLKSAWYGRAMLVSNVSNPTESNHSERSTESSTSGARYHRVLPARFGFYFPVHDQVEGVVEVLKSTRYFYPEAPIFVLQDGGSVDFGPFCKLQRPGEKWEKNWWFHPGWLGFIGDDYRIIYIIYTYIYIYYKNN